MARSKEEIISDMVDAGMSDDEIRSAFSSSPKSSPTTESKSPDLLSTLYHGAIEGGAMTLGGAAGLALGSPAGPVGSGMAAAGMSAAMYSPAKRFAEGIDRMRGIEPPPQKSLATEFTEGLAMEAVPKVAGPVLKKVGRGLAQMAETASGVKKDIYEQAAKQGYSTYLKPGMDAAKGKFAQALGPEGQAALKQTSDEVFSSQAGLSRRIARKAASRLGADPEAEKISIDSLGVPFRDINRSPEPLSAVEALKARQATDRVISATPVTDDKALQSLYEWRGKFDKVMTDQSGELKDASNMYRQAIVKDKILNLTRLTKSGKPSAFLPMILGAGSRGVAGALSLLSATSPAIWGLGATTAGQASKMMTPSLQRAVMTAFIDKVTTKED